jgi:hypothetical protein
LSDGHQRYRTPCKSRSVRNPPFPTRSKDEPTSFTCLPTFFEDKTCVYPRPDQRLLHPAHSRTRHVPEDNTPQEVSRETRLICDQLPPQVCIGHHPACKGQSASALLSLPMRTMMNTLSFLFRIVCDATTRVLTGDSRTSIHEN